MKIYAPVKDANGVWASVLFVNGVGETNKPHLIKWFKDNGYRIEEETISPTTYSEEVLTQVVEKVDSEPNSEPNFDGMTPNELREWMRDNGYGGQIKNIRNKDKLLEILRG